MSYWCTSLVVVVILPYFMMCRGQEVMFPFGLNKILIEKSWGLPAELTCEDLDNPRIKVSGITLDYKTNITTAENKYPGIQNNAQKDCDKTHTMPTATRPAGCRIELPGLGVPNNEMVITVFWCFSGSESYSTKDHIASSKSGDVRIKCDYSDIINIREIKLNNEPLADLELLIRKCLDDMMKSKLPNGSHNPSKPGTAACSIERNGRKGELQVKYRCDSPPPAHSYVNEPEPPRHPMPPS